MVIGSKKLQSKIIKAASRAVKGAVIASVLGMAVGTILPQYSGIGRLVGAWFGGGVEGILGDQLISPLLGQFIPQITGTGGSELGSGSGAGDFI